MVRATKISRATIHPIIKKLKERGFINHEGPNTQLRWFIESEDNIIRTLQDFTLSEPSEPPYSSSSPGYQP